MNDIVAVALISAGSSLIGASVGALTTYKVSLRNAEATVATSQSQHEVEITRIEAENKRLQQNNREEERRNRQSTYHQHVNALIVLFQLMGFAATQEQINEACDSYRYLHAGVVLFAPTSVRNGAYAVSHVYGEIWPALTKQREENPEKPSSQCWRDATADLKEKFGDEISKLTGLMHADVTRGIADDPEKADRTGDA